MIPTLVAELKYNIQFIFHVFKKSVCMFLSQWRWLVRIQCHIRVASSSFYLWLYAFVWPTQLVSRVLSPSVSFHAHVCFWKPLAELTWGRGQCPFTYLLITWNLAPDHAKWRKWAWKETHIGKNSQIRQMDPGRHRKKNLQNSKGKKSSSSCHLFTPHKRAISEHKTSFELNS